MAIHSFEILSVPVSDQERAKLFYRDVLGFELIREEPMGPSKWIQLAPKGCSTTIALVGWFEGMKPGNLQGVMVNTDDIDKDHANFRRVAFKSPRSNNSPGVVMPCSRIRTAMGGSSGSRRASSLGALILLGFALAARAQTPAADLLKPPWDAEKFLIVSAAGKHGESYRWIENGLHHGRETLNLRGQLTDLDTTSHLGVDGMFDRVTVRGMSANSDAAETFFIAGGRATWKSPVDGTSGRYPKNTLYWPFGGALDVVALGYETLLKAPDQTLPLLPAGQMHAERLLSTTLERDGSKKTATLYVVLGQSYDPVPVWMDESGRFFAAIADLAYLPERFAADLPTLQAEQDAALAKRSLQIARGFLKQAPKVVAFTHVRAFVDAKQFLDNQTVVVEGGKIASIGSDDKAKIPSGAQRIDGAGKTLIPGLIDVHQHVPSDAAGPLLLSFGITSVRDPGNIDALTLARAKRRAGGELVLPHVYPSMLIDGSGPNSAQVGHTVTSQNEALARVREAKEQGFVGIKLYGSFDPNWVNATAAEAHRLGLHVHGHVPAGMRPAQAIDAGYDEITHAYFALMQAMPDEVVQKSNGAARWEGIARFGKDVDLSKDPMKALIGEMAERHISIDPTLVVVESLLVPDVGEVTGSYASYLEVMPPTVSRQFHAGGIDVPKDLKRADLRASFQKCLAMVQALHRLGVNVVAGTDGNGMELVHELELYQAAGFTPEEALNAATLSAARLLGADSHTGSISVGKDADLVLIEGDPSKHLSDLRQTRLVMMDGSLMNADELRKAGGLTGRPH